MYPCSLWMDDKYFGNWMDKHFSDLECSLLGAAESEIFQDKGGRDFPGVKSEVMKPRRGLIL